MNCIERDDVGLTVKDETHVACRMLHSITAHSVTVAWHARTSNPKHVSCNYKYLRCVFHANIS